MKTKTKENSRLKVLKNTSDKHTYYFHADDDFREDRDWGKAKTTKISKSKPVKKTAQ